MIGSFLVRILQYGPFPWKWSNLCIFVLEQSQQIQNLQPKQQKKTVKSAIRIISNLQTELAQAILGNIGPHAQLEAKYKKGVSVLEQKQKE